MAKRNWAVLVLATLVLAGALVVLWLESGHESLGRSESDQVSDKRPAASSVQGNPIRNISVPFGRQQGNGTSDAGMPVDLIAELGKIQTADKVALKRYFDDGMRSGASVEAQYLASMVFQFCAGHVNPRIFTYGRDFRNKGTTRPEDLEAWTLSASIEKMGTRCDGLSEIGVDGWRRAGARFAKTVYAADSPFAREQLPASSGEVARDESRERIRQALERYGAAALDWKGADLLELASQEKGRAGRLQFEAYGDVEAVAVLLAPCFASQPCGEDTLKALGLCISSGGKDCKGDVVASTLNHFEKPQDRERARKLAQEIALAIQSLDWRRLGLD